MLGVLYLILSSFVGYYLLKKFLPVLFTISKTTSLNEKPLKLSSWMITLPSAFLVGTLFFTWFTYLITWLIAHFFGGLERPLLLGDIITFLILILLIIYITKRNNYLQYRNKFNWKDAAWWRQLILNNKFELVYMLIVTVVWSFFIFRSFNIFKGTLHIGVSVFSDFGNTLAILRSFSWGSNFPTEFPHYAGLLNGFNDIRYHFMFQFLAGNLEFLGLRLDWAFNLPSIFSLVAFMMLLYAFVVLLLGERWIGIITAILFFFRSSFAFFTNIIDMRANGVHSIRQGILSILYNATNIGKTEHEIWGFWAQKVYMNKRHFAFTLGIAMLVFIVILPLFKKMIQALKATKVKSSEGMIENTLTESSPETSLGLEAEIESEEDLAGNKPANSRKNHPILLRFQLWFKEFFFSKDAWESMDIKQAIFIGLLLGLISFWNGATVIAVLAVLFMIAIFSKHRLDFFNIAVITIILTLLQSKFFMGMDSATNEISMMVGFLAAQKDFPGILLYYLELLGILPLVLLMALYNTSKGLRWLMLAFLAPLIVATTMKFSVDVGANHVIIIFSVMLLNIIAANFLFQLFQATNLSRSLVMVAIILVLFGGAAYILRFDLLILPTLVVFGGLIILIFVGKYLFENIFKNISWIQVFPVSAAIFLMGILIATGVVDILTLYNQDRGSLEYRTDDPELLWIAKNTGPNELFLIHPNYQNTVLLAGRKVFLGGSYFTWTSGYDPNSRFQSVRQIYGEGDPAYVKKLVQLNQIKYIVIEDENRNATEYRLNEDLFKNNFKLVYENLEKRVAIYRTY